MNIDFDASDTIESLGIKRTFKKMEQSHIILWMIDSTDVKGGSKSYKTEILPHLPKVRKLDYSVQ